VKPTHLLLPAALASAMIASAVAAADARVPAAHAARAATVQLRSTSLGKILVNSSGFTLYEFTKDSRNKNTCVKVSGCSAVWPALSAHGSTTAGPGVKASLLSSITLPGGARQVTYAGHPLYLYSEASERGETSYVGVSHFGGKWLAVNAAGHAVS
jgi:predicted lipoprotein with Yx(FWY)xxD motif